MKLDAKRFLVFVLIVGMLVFSMLALSMPWELIPLTAGVVGLVISMNRLNEELLEDERKKLDPEWLPYIQSPEVDKVLSRYYIERTRSHKERPELDSTQAWSDYGLGEMRSLLHQSLNVSCKDETIVTFCRPAWLLAWIHARKDAQALQQQHEKELEDLKREREESDSHHASELEREQERYRSVEPGILAAQEALKKEQEAHTLTRERLKEELAKLAAGLSGSHLKNAQLTKQVEELSRTVEELKQRNQQLVIQLAQTPITPQAPPKFSTTAERNAAILQYIADGHKQPEAAEYFGLKVNNVKQIVYQANKGKAADGGEVVEEETVNE